MKRKAPIFSVHPVLASYHCLRCGARFRCAPAMVSCPTCKGLRIEWTNYEQMKASFENLAF
jgi:DNA polymerase II large subunit